MPKRILLVDDNRDSVEALGALLEFEGHEVRCVFDAREALLAVQSFEPDVAFVDWKLPDMSGGQLLTQFKRDPRMANTRFVLLSGFVDPDLASDANGARFDQSLTKPVQLDDLLSCIR
jgi:CheY-like chemotaxis protein